MKRRYGLIFLLAISLVIASCAGFAGTKPTIQPKQKATAVAPQPDAQFPAPTIQPATNSVSLTMKEIIIIDKKETMPDGQVAEYFIILALPPDGSQPTATIPLIADSLDGYTEYRYEFPTNYGVEQMTWVIKYTYFLTCPAMDCQIGLFMGDQPLPYGLPLPSVPAGKEG